MPDGSLSAVLPLGMLDGPGASTWVGALVFVDKYTGPLGGAAVEISLLVMLRQASADESATSLPVAFLMTLTALSTKCVRPVVEMAVIHEPSWPVPLPAVATGFALCTFGFVTYLLSVHWPAKPVKED